MSFTQMKQIFSKKNIVCLLFIITLFFLLGENAFAATDTTSGTPSQQIAKVGTDVANNASKLVATLLGLATQFVALFMHPGWYSGQIFDINLYLKSIWILMSNVVYFIFAFLLIAIAFMNIIGKEGDNFALKTALPRFIVGILIVPFSWFIVQFILSISGILTVSVLALPYDTFKDYDFFKKIEGTICTERTLTLGETGDGSSLDEWFKCDGKEVPIQDILKSADSKGDHQDSIFSLISIYTYGVLALGEADTLNGIDTVAKGGIGTLATLSFKVFFQLIFILVYLILMLALFMALFSRGVWLWLYMMASPLFGLMYFFKKGGGGEDALWGKFTFGKFVQLALVPVYVAAALSFGLLFIFVAASGMNESKTTEWSIMSCDNPGDSKDPSCAITIGSFKLTVKGAFGSGQSILGNAISTAGSALGSLIIQLFGIAVLWMGVMAAIRSSDITKAVVEPIYQFGQTVGKTMAALPQYVPILPGGMSVKGLDHVAKNVSASMETSATNSGEGFASALGLPGSSGTQLRSASTNASTAIKTYGGEDRTSWQKFKAAFDEGKDTAALAKESEFVGATKLLLEKIGKTDEANKLSVGDRAALSKALWELEKYAEHNNKPQLMEGRNTFSPWTESIIDTYKKTDITPSGDQTQTPSTTTATPLISKMATENKYEVIADSNTNITLDMTNASNPSMSAAPGVDIALASKNLKSLHTEAEFRTALTGVGIQDVPQQDAIIAKLGTSSWKGTTS